MESQARSVFGQHLTLDGHGCPASHEGNCYAGQAMKRQGAK